MNREVYNYIKSISIVEFLEEYGFDIVNGGSCNCCSGGYKKMICPIHNDKNPSFHIHPGTNSWYCFGCGSGGTVIDFIVSYENITLSEALKKFVVKDNKIKYDLMRKRIENLKTSDHSNVQATRKRIWIELGLLIRDFVKQEMQDQMFKEIDDAFDSDALNDVFVKEIKTRIKNFRR